METVSDTHRIIPNTISSYQQRQSRHEDISSSTKGREYRRYWHRTQSFSQTFQSAGKGAVLLFYHLSFLRIYHLKLDRLQKFSKHKKSDPMYLENYRRILLSHRFSKNGLILFSWTAIQFYWYISYTGK